MNFFERDAAILIQRINSWRSSVGGQCFISDIANSYGIRNTIVSELQSANADIFNTQHLPPTKKYKDLIPSCNNDKDWGVILLAVGTYSVFLSVLL